MVAKEENKEHEGIWQQILSESTRFGQGSIEGRTLLILGERNTGKTAIVSKLQKKDEKEMYKGLAVDYSFIDVKEDDDILTKINVWQLEGEESHSHLLQFAINSENIDKSAILIVLDLSQPWNLVDHLEKWLKVAKTHLSSLKLSRNTSEHLLSSLRKRFKSYKEPEKAAVKKKKIISLKSSPSDDLENIEDGGIGGMTLTENLGVPIIVVCTKSDSISSLQREFGYNDNTFEYIQQHLRRICLSYGASLIYLSSRKNNNCDILSDYIEHILYGFDFVYQPALEKDSIFVPIGWDSIDKIDMDFENQNLCSDPNTPFNDVIPKPKSILQQEMEEEMTVAEDDQEFLQRHKNTLDVKDQVKDKTKKASESNIVNSPSPSISTSPSSGQSPSLPNAADFFGSLGITRTPTSSNNSPITNSPLTPMKSSAASNLNAKLPNSPNLTSNDDISKFFNDLLAKKK